MARLLIIKNGQTTGAFKLFSDFRYARVAYGNIGSAQRMDGTKNLYGYNAAGEVVSDRTLRGVVLKKYEMQQRTRITMRARR